MAEAEDGATECVNLTSQVTEPPRSTKEEIVAAFREETDDNSKIRNGQVDNQHVGRNAQFFVIAEDPQDHHVAKKGNSSCIRSGLF